MSLFCCRRNSFWLQYTVNICGEMHSWKLTSTARCDRRTNHHERRKSNSSCAKRSTAYIWEEVFPVWLHPLPRGASRDCRLNHGREFRTLHPEGCFVCLDSGLATEFQSQPLQLMRDGFPGLRRNKGHACAKLSSTRFQNIPVPLFSS